MIQDKPFFDFVFVVLVYRNTSDLKDFFSHFAVPNSKVIVVNSFYDGTSENEFKEIATKHQSDFISVPNKGYGAGNNKGVSFALEHYGFKYLVISNADVIIENLNLSAIERYGDEIVAPKILTLKGNNQNPSSPFPPHKVSLKIMIYIYEGGHRLLAWPMHAWSRIKKIFFYLISPLYKYVFSAHGAFVIIPFGVIRELHPLFNEEMFLEYEEQHLGMYAKSRGIKTRYVPEIVIRHKEDGSMKIASINEFEVQKQSFNVYYHYWFSK